MTSLKYLQLPLLGLILVWLTGCASAPAPVTTTGVQVDPDLSKQEQVVQLARSMIGKPYHYGGISPSTGFDCSGLVYFTHKRLGKTLPRTSHGQYSASQPVSRKNIQRGDLLFFRINRRKISHVGIYLGKNRFVHAPSSGKAVEIADLNEPYWRHRLVRGGRFF